MVTFIPLEKTAAGWKIQLDGRIFFAVTERDFAPGQPVRARVRNGHGGLNLEVPAGPGDMSSAAHPLLQAMAKQGRSFVPSQWERLNKLWNRAPGSTESEKAKILWELEDSGLAWLNVVRGLKDLMDGNWLSGGGNGGRGRQETTGQDNPDADEEGGGSSLSVDSTSEAAAACDLWNSKSRHDPHRWLMIPFCWKGPHGEEKGLARFKIREPEGRAECWNFSLLEPSWGFLMREIPYRELTVFSPDQDRKGEELERRLRAVLGPLSVKFRPFSSWDGFEGTGGEVYRTLDETV